MRLEVCIDSLESAQNAIAGGVDELEACSILTEGGLTPSPGLVFEVIKLECKINVMIRCRSGSDFCFSEDEMITMLSDIDFYKTMNINSFVFGALTRDRDIDIENCKRVIDKAHPLPVTFHRAFDVCRQPQEAIHTIISLGFKRLLTSGQKTSAAEIEAKEMIQKLLKYSNQIEIMPGSGISYKNVHDFLKMGCKIVHSSCKVPRRLECGAITMGSSEVYITDVDAVKKLKRICNT